MKTDEVRARFLEFFRRHDHRIVPSDSLIPQDDPTLLFTGAGMNQFKAYFLGEKADMKRAASSQKCLRTGDLDEVGRTAYHQSFFEMLGNFSFGDYFKREAIAWAWEFLTKDLRIEAARLDVSVHSDDREAFEIWQRESGLPAGRIHRLGDHTNFWPSNARADGPNGPCGPCSEIFFDQGKGVGCGRPSCDVSCSCGRFAEIWNLVFTQFDRREGGTLAPLAARNIDTGMGLERLACVLQGKRSNFEIDCLKPLVSFVIKICRVKRERIADANAIADHARAAVFAVGDGVHPSNERRGYVVRKLIRRAVWRAWTLENRKPFLYQMVPQVIELMKVPYPELARVEKEVQLAIRSEEERFLATLEEGLAQIGKIFERLSAKGARVITGEELFKLYDTYGFPDELARQLARERGLEIDGEGFEKLMEDQRKRAKGASFADGTIFAKGAGNPFQGIAPTRFLGYEALEADCTILKVVGAGPGDVWVALDQTPFYAESGGQVGDSGLFEAKSARAEVLDTQNREGVFAHRLRLERGRLQAGDRVRASVHRETREATMRNHTATHLLQSALRSHLGPQVRQLGSLVTHEKLRFDFSYPRALTREEICAVEDFVNAEILANHAVSKVEKPLEEAQREGALSFFGEKYASRVRVVSVAGVSKELCGGTHVRATGDIGSFLIVSESSVASGTRRIEAITGKAVVARVRELDGKLGRLAALLKTSPDHVAQRVERLLKEAAGTAPRAERELPAIESVLAHKQRVGKHDLVVQKFEKLTQKELRTLWDRLKASAKHTVALLASVEGNRVNILCGLTKDLMGQGLHAGRMVEHVARELGGSGGGREDLGEGGAKEAQALERALADFPAMLTPGGAREGG